MKRHCRVTQAVKLSCHSIQQLFFYAMSAPSLTRLVGSLPSTVPFVGPETQERQLERAFLARVGANESVFGPSPKVTAAIAEMATDIWRYGDPETFDLKAALATKHGVSSKNIVIGEGIDGVLGNLVRLFVEPDVAVVTSDGAYPTFNYHVAGFGGDLLKVPFSNDHEDPDALLEKARMSGARLVYLSNPNNPMGSFHQPAIIEKMVSDLPDGCLLCLDEAYADFVDEDELPAIPADHPQVIRFRTFSKAYGLAGIRIGYAITNAPLADAFNRIRNHFGVNIIGQAAALAALDDTAHQRSVRSAVAESLSHIADIAGDNECHALPTRSNFIAIDCGRDGNFAGRVLASLIDQGIFVRMPGVAPLNRCIRVSAGTAEDVGLFKTAFPQALQVAAR
jgi:histidinol-phosphate aminotransferase